MNKPSYELGKSSEQMVVYYNAEANIMRQIKGAFFINIVKPIRADKDGVFDKYFTEEDRDVINSTILSANWYSFDLFKKCLNALADVYAKGDMEIVKQWGFAGGEKLITSAYKTVVKDKDYKLAFQKLKSFWKLRFDFGEYDLTFISDNELKVTFIDFDPDAEVFFWYVLGWYEKVLEICGCKNVQSEISVKSWEGAGDPALHYSWSS